MQAPVVSILILKQVVCSLFFSNFYVQMPIFLQFSCRVFFLLHSFFSVSNVLIPISAIYLLRFYKIFTSFHSNDRVMFSRYLFTQLIWYHYYFPLFLHSFYAYFQRVIIVLLSLFSLDRVFLLFFVVFFFIYNVNLFKQDSHLARRHFHCVVVTKNFPSYAIFMKIIDSVQAKYISFHSLPCNTREHKS
jgi:hypothetical protein